MAMASSTFAQNTDRPKRDRRLYIKGRRSVAQTTGITLAAKFENFEQSDTGK
jgi:hypothetical protein